MKLVVLIALCVLGTHAQDVNQTDPNMGQQPYPLPDMSGLGAAAASVQLAQQASNHYAKFFLEFQSVMSWIQVSSSFAKMIANDSPQNLEEDVGFADLEEEEKVDIKLSSAIHRNLEMIPGPLMGQTNQQQNQSPEDIEHQFESSLLYITKLMQIENVYKLHQTQHTHYQTKVQLMMLQSAGGSYGPLSSVLYMLWYKDIIDTLNSAISFQMQDAWTFWLYHDITETTEFRGNPTPEFRHKLHLTGAKAFELWYMRSLLDVQSMYISMYVNQIFAYVLRSMQPQPAASSSASLLEVEAEAEPAKPFFAGPQGAYMMAYYYYMLGLWAKFMEMSTAQTFHMFGQMKLNPDSPQLQRSGMSLERVRLMGAYSLQQWVWVRTIQMVMQLYALYMSMISGHGSLGMGSLGMGSLAGMGSMGPGMGSMGMPGYMSNLMQTDQNAESPVQNPEAAQQDPVQATPTNTQMPNLVG